MKVEVKLSKVEGLGCFATADMAEGEMVGLYEGLAMMVDTGDEPPSRHFLYLDAPPEVKCSGCERERFHHGILGTGLLKYINSTQDQEVEQNVDTFGPFIVTTRPIPMGEELLMDYEFNE